MLRKLARRRTIAPQRLRRHRPAVGGSKCARSGRLGFEPLEPRLVLDGGGLPAGDVFPADEATFDDLRITEIMYHPRTATTAEELAGFSKADFEFIEVKNTGDGDLNLAGVTISVDIGYTFGNVTLGPEEYLVLARSPNGINAIGLRYGPTVDVTGQYTDALSNGGGRIVLKDPQLQTILDFVFLDDDWYPSTDGGGHSLVIVDPAGDRATWGNKDSWRPSGALHGSPGRGPVVPPAGAIVINEVLTHTDADPRGDWIELLNTTDDPIEIGGWFLSDDNNTPKKYEIPAGYTIWPHKYGLFKQVGNFGGVGPKSFGLSELGDEVHLSSAAGGNLTGYHEWVEFGAAEREVTFGRYTTSTGDVDFTPLASPTSRADNAPPLIGPVVINEIMYNPPGVGDDGEFVELHNWTGQAVKLYDPIRPANTWKFDKGIEFSFPRNVQIPAGGYALVVPISPAVFRATYGIAAATAIYGPYAGSLDNDNGEAVALSRPGDPEPDGFVPYYRVDRVRYDDRAPWSERPDDNGPALIRLHPDQYGNDPINWTASAVGGTPGTENVVPQASIAGRHVFYNNSTFDVGNPAANQDDGNAVATDKTALRPGGLSGFANYTSYSRGINGIMVDVADLPGGVIPDANDFEFRVGNDNDPSTWPFVSTDAGVTLWPGDGTDDSDRVTLVWPDYAVRNQWLQVTVRGERLGLAEDDVFYFGNAVAESGNADSDAQVTTTDLLLARNNPRNDLTPADIDFPYDYNRDGHVNTTDVLLARNHQTNFLTALKLIDLQGVQAAATDAAWLYEYAQTGAGSGPSGKRAPAAEAVDALLATYGR